MTIILEGLNPELHARADWMLALGQGHLRISSAVRTRAQQEVLYAAFKRDPVHNATAAVPGTSNHERGLAIDIECAYTFNSERASIARTVGLHTPIKGEPWHMELDPQRAPFPPKPITLQEATQMVDPAKRKAVALLPSKSGNGYMITTDDGGVYCLGDFPFHGSVAGQRLNAPIVSAVAHPGGNGYWLIGEDGGIFAFGDAGFFGSGVDLLKS